MKAFELSVNTVSQLINFDKNYYRKHYRDLAPFSDEELLEHYAGYGYFEGRTCHALALRENLIESVGTKKTLEIGPFADPAILHENAKYFDILTTEELRQRAAKYDLPTDNLREIDFVSPEASLDIVDEKFEVVFSKHCLEHQPDLIRHLNEVAALLEDGGSYQFVVPNARYCFDANLPLSSISHVLTAHELGRTVHTIGNVVEHRALTTHNDSEKHWNQSFEQAPDYEPLDTKKIANAIAEYKAANGGYVDVHSWQFQPHTLSDIMRVLIELNYIPFREVRCYGPVAWRNEFCAELIK